MQTRHRHISLSTDFQQRHTEREVSDTVSMFQIRAFLCCVCGSDLVIWESFAEIEAFQRVCYVSSFRLCRVFEVSNVFERPRLWQL